MSDSADSTPAPADPTPADPAVSDSSDSTFEDYQIIEPDELSRAGIRALPDLPTCKPAEFERLSPSPFDSQYPQTASFHPKWQRLTEDGHVLKFTLTKGEGEKDVPPLVRVYLNVIGKLGDGSTFLDYPLEEYDFILGQAQAPKALEMAVCNMKPKEIALIRGSSTYNWTKARKPGNVPEDANLFFYVNIVRIEKEPNLHELNEEEKLKFSESRREIGKLLFQQGKYRSALKQYDKALLVLKNVQDKQLPMESPGAQGQKGDKEEINGTVGKWRELKALMYSNSAACKMKLGDYGGAVSDCTESLFWNPNQAKVVFRLAEAYKMREEFFEAKREFRKIIQAGTGMGMGMGVGVEENEISVSRSQNERENDDDNEAEQEKEEKENTTTASAPSLGQLVVDDAMKRIARSQLDWIEKRERQIEREQRERLGGFLQSNQMKESGLLYSDMPDVGPNEAEKMKEGMWFVNGVMKCYDVMFRCMKRSRKWYYQTIGKWMGIEDPKLVRKRERMMKIKAEKEKLAAQQQQQSGSGSGSATGNTSSNESKKDK